MTTTLHKESAKIYEFPVGGRSGFKRRDWQIADAEAEVAPLHPVRIASGSGWYHEAALQEELTRLS